MVEITDVELVKNRAVEFIRQLQSNGQVLCDDDDFIAFVEDSYQALHRISSCDKADIYGFVSATIKYAVAVYADKCRQKGKFDNPFSISELRDVFLDLLTDDPYVPNH